ncbi:MAG: tripartite tricarboxylate transporter substrate binding protein [Betaproteobacteria bacterium]|nr:MAG: tripartite tricarboxylate transporter substrate binding protein [Betaproteobacteria bacterium]
MIRCRTLSLVASSLVALYVLSPAVVHAQAYPSKPIRFIVPWPPGGGADIMSRLINQQLGDALGQQVVIDNRGGAAGNIGAELAAKSPPDGYTIVFAYSGTHSINPHIYRRMPFKGSDLTAIIQLASVPQIVVVHPSLPAKSVRELIAIVKAKPGQLSYASSGNGAINHLAGELFKMRTGTDIVHVPYKGGGPAAVALLSGEVGMIFGEPASMMGFLKAGKLRALAVTSGKRALSLPELPTVSEAGVPGYDVTSWNGILAPAATPREIVGRLNAELNKIIAAPAMRDRMIGLGYEPVGGPPEKFDAFIQSELAKWAPVVKAAGVRID